MSPRAIVLRSLGLGDGLSAVPALRALRSALRDHELVLAGPAGVGRMLAKAGIVDEVLAMPALVGANPQWPEAKDVIPATSFRPDIAVNLHGRGPQSHRFLKALAPAGWVSFANAESGVAGPTWREDENERARWCRLVSSTLGVPADPDDVRLPAPPGDESAAGAVVVHPGAASAARRWPVERWADVVAKIATEHRVLITGTAREADLAHRLARLASLPAEQVFAGRTDITRLSALVAAARLVLCGDTGVAHLASAFGTPSVVLFGPTSPGRWGPPASGPHTALWHGPTEGDPHADRPHAALLDITVREVDEAAERMLRLRLLASGSPR